MAKDVDVRHPIIQEFQAEQRKVWRADQETWKELFAKLSNFKEHPSGSLQEILAEKDERVCVDAGCKAIQESDMGTVRSLEHDGFTGHPETPEDGTEEWRKDTLAKVNEASPHAFQIKAHPSPEEILANLAKQYPEFDFQTVEDFCEKIENNRMLLATYLQGASSTNVDIIVSDLLVDHHLYMDGVEFTVQEVWHCIPDERTQNFAQWDQKKVGGSFKLREKCMEPCADALKRSSRTCGRRTSECARRLPGYIRTGVL